MALYKEEKSAGQAGFKRGQHTLTGHFIRYTFLVLLFVLRNALILCGVFNKVLETFLRDLAPVAFVLDFSPYLDWSCC